MKKFDVKIMQWGVTYHHNCTQEEFLEHYGDEYEAVDTADGRCLRESGTYPRIWTRDNQLGSIVHEVSHAVFWIINEMGMSINGETEELMAYANEFLVTEIIKKLKMTIFTME